MKSKLTVSRMVFFAIGASILLAWPAVSAAAGDAKPELWKQAVSYLEKQAKVLPKKFFTRMELLDRKGKAGEVSEQWYVLVRSESGKYKQELAKAVKNGVDVTEKERAALLKAEAKRKEKSKDKARFDFTWGDTPLNPAKQDQVTVRETSERRSLYGRSCLRFDYTMRLGADAEGGMKGMVWIDDQTGCPVKIEFTRDPLPRFVKSFWSVFRFDTEPSGTWVLSEISMEGEGGLLFIKKHFRSTITFDDFQAEPESEK